jgi:hypothetical protein
MIVMPGTAADAPPVLVERSVWQPLFGSYSELKSADMYGSSPPGDIVVEVTSLRYDYVQTETNIYSGGRWTIRAGERIPAAACAEPVPVDAEMAAMLSAVPAHWVKLHLGTARSPATLQEAGYLVNQFMSSPSEKCAEFHGVYYFSGGLGRVKEDDFRRGFAIPKGETNVFHWSLPK